MNNQANTPNSQPTTTTFPFTQSPWGRVPAPSPHQWGNSRPAPLRRRWFESQRSERRNRFRCGDDRIISLMEQGTAPWRASWVGTAGKPISLSTGKP